MLVWVSRQAPSSVLVLPPVPFWFCTWAWFSREVLSAVASGKWVCQWHAKLRAFRSQTDWSRHPCAQTSRQGHHCRKTWPQGSSHFLVSALSFHSIGDSHSCPLDLELVVLTKWLASLIESHFENSIMWVMWNLCRICRRISMNISKVGNQTSSQDPQAVNSRSVTKSNLIINALKFTLKSEFLKHNLATYFTWHL